MGRPPVCPSCGHELPAAPGAELACPCGSLLRLHLHVEVFAGSLLRLHRIYVEVFAGSLRPPADLTEIRPDARATARDGQYGEL